MLVGGAEIEKLVGAAAVDCTVAADVVRRCGVACEGAARLEVARVNAGSKDRTIGTHTRPCNAWAGGRAGVVREKVVAAGVGDCLGHDVAAIVGQHDQHACNTRLSWVLDAVVVEVKPDKVTRCDRHGVPAKVIGRCVAAWACCGGCGNNRIGAHGGRIAIGCIVGACVLGREGEPGEGAFFVEDADWDDVVGWIVEHHLVGCIGG